MSAAEILIACALLAAAFIPVYSLIQGNQQTAYLNELQILARRRALRALAALMGHPYHELEKRAQGDAPPAGIVGLPAEGAEIPLALPPAKEDALLLGMPETILQGYIGRIDGMTTRAFFHELDPGLGRVSVLVTWKDPTSEAERSYATVRFVEDPFHWRQGP